jgi:XTP/dITP diphosphohydrolase
MGLHLGGNLMSSPIFSDSERQDSEQPDSERPDSVAELASVIDRLRSEGGCAWCAEQTHASLVRYLVEETYELIDSIESGSRDDMLEELGDVLYQVLFHADIASKTAGEDFDLQHVAAHTAEKMRSRHPHVFADVRADTPDEVIAVWEQSKREEKSERSSTLDGVPQGMPALLLADKLLGKADKLGVVSLDGPSPFQFGDERELGAVLLALVASARGQGLDAERALRVALRRLQDDIRDAE